MKSKVLTGLLVLLISMSARYTRASDLEKATEKVDAQGAKSLVIDCEFGAGDLEIVTADIEEAAILEVRYDPERVEYTVNYEKHGDVGHLYLESNSKHRTSFRKADNSWRLTLSTRYPAELTFEIGASEADIDFGGLPVTDLNLQIGAASGKIDFSKPNPERLRSARIDVGASSVEFTNLGNANFDYLKFSGGATSSDLDFMGSYTGKSEVKLDIGLGSADVVLPENLPVRIESDDEGFLSSVDFHDLDIDEIRDGVYESPGFDDAENKMLFILDIGLGSVDIYGK